MKIEPIRPGFRRAKSWIAFSICLFLILLVGLCIVGRVRERMAMEGTHSSETAEIAELIQVGRTSEIELGTLLAIDSMKQVPRLENDRPVRRSIQLLRTHVYWIHHKRPVRAVAYSGDGQWGATASEDGTSLLFKAESPASSVRIDHKGVVTSVAFDSASGLLATGSLDKTVRIVSLNRREPRRMPDQPIGTGILTLAFRPRTRQLALGTNNKSVILLDVDSRTTVPLGNFGNDGDSVPIIAFNADGSLLGVVSTNTVWVVDMRTKKRIKLQHGGLVNSVEFAPNGEQIATASNDKTARVFDARTGKEIKHLIHPDAVRVVVFSPNGDKLATGGADRVARVFNMGKECEEIAHLMHDGPVKSLQFTQDGVNLITGSTDNTARIFNVYGSKEVGRLGHASPVTSLALSTDGQNLATASADGVRIFQIRDLTEITRIASPGSADHATFVQDRQKIAIVLNARAFVFNGNGKLIRPSLSLHAPESQFLAVSRDGEMLASAGVNDVVDIVNLSTGESVSTPEKDISAASFLGEGKVLAIATKEPPDEPGQPERGVIKWIDSGTGKYDAKRPVLRCDGHINVIAISSDLHYLAAGTSYGTAVVFDLVDPKGFTNRTFSHQRSVSVNAVAFSADGQWLAIGSANKITKLFDLKTGTEITPSFDSNGPVSRLVFDQSRSRIAIMNQNSEMGIFDIGRHLKVGQISGADVKDIAFGENVLLTLSVESNSIRVRKYDLRPPELINQACSLLENNLTTEQWKRFFPNEHYRKICPLLP